MIVAVAVLSICLLDCPSLFILYSNGFVTILLAPGSGEDLVATVQLGERSVRMVVDTGANKTILDAVAAGRVGVKANPSFVMSTTASGGTLPMALAVVPALRVGSAVVHRAEIGVADLSRSVARGGATDGILGADLLRPLGAVIDCHRRTLRVRTAGLRDLAAMQGRWWVVEYQLDGETYHRRDHPTLGNVRATVTGTHMWIDHSREGRPVEEFDLQLQPDHRPRRYVGSTVRRDGHPGADPDSVANGLYESVGGRLRWLSCGTKVVPPEAMPKELVAANGSGLQVYTFERPPPLLGWQVLHLAATRLGLDRPAGWELSVAPDWTLTGVHPGRSLQFRATPGGHMSVETVRP